MWYDEIGLLKPAFVKDNGYRYYTFHQSAELETILMLRDLQVPLAEIKAFMAQRSAASLAAMLGDKLIEVDARIADLQALRTTMAARRQEMQQLCTLDLDAIVLVQHNERQLVTVPTTVQASLGEEIERVLAMLKTLHLKRFYDASYGAMLPVEAIYEGRFDDYTALTLTLPLSLCSGEWHTQPAGFYLRAYCQGAWEELPQRYRALCAYAEQEGLTFVGHAYERGINDVVTMRMEESITEIEIPVRRK